MWSREESRETPRLLSSLKNRVNINGDDVVGWIVSHKMHILKPYPPRTSECDIIWR